MASVRKLPNGRWQVRYWGSDGTQHKKNYLRKTDADRFATSVEAAKLHGEWVDPRLGKLTLAEWVVKAEGAEARLRASTRTQHDAYLRNHVLPAFGKRRIADIRQEEVATWVSQLVAKDLAPATVRKAYQIFARVMKTAVEAGRLTRTPCVSIRLPEVPQEDMRFLSPEEVAHLASEIDPRYRAFVLLGAYGGLRRAELFGLRQRRVMALRSAVEVAEILYDGLFGPPKTKASRRVVPLPRVIVDELAEHIARYGARDGRGELDPDGLVFRSPEGHPIRASLFYRRFWQPAVVRAGLAPLRIHDLRHTAVALWIEGGAHAPEIAARAGHRTQTIMDRYRHILPRTEDRVNERLEAIYREARGSRR